MPLLGKSRLSEYAVTLRNGEEQWTEYVYAPDSEHAAWAALELSKNRKANLTNVYQTDEW